MGLGWSRKGCSRGKKRREERGREEWGREGGKGAGVRGEERWEGEEGREVGERRGGKRGKRRELKEGSRREEGKKEYAGRIISGERTAPRASVQAHLGIVALVVCATTLREKLQGSVLPLRCFHVTPHAESAV